MPRKRRLFGVVGAIALALICTIAGTNLFFLGNLRENTLQNAETNLARYSLTLAENADRSIKSADLVLSSVAEYVSRKGVVDGGSFRAAVSDRETYSLLKEKIAGLPQIDAVAIIDAQGKLLNFSRYWPIPEVNISDRNYFKSLTSDPSLKSFISEPLQNRRNGTWNIYIARRLNDAKGEFMGMLLGALSVQNLENFFGSTSLGLDSTISLVREDGVILAHFPPTDDLGRQSSGGGLRALAAGGTIREINRKDTLMGLRAARMLPDHPALIVVSQTENSALKSWYSLATLLTAMSLISAIAVVVAASIIGRWWNRHESLIQASEAVKFTAAGEVTVSTRCIARDDQSATIEWSVSDTGIGIAPDKIGSLFANFVQADNSISRRFGGSGLGLAICKRLTEQMGGEIKLQSTLGRGSTFSFHLTLPVAAAIAVPEQNDENVYDTLQAKITSYGRPLRVLVVEDNPTNRLVATKMLNDFDIQADIACDGAEAVTAAGRFKYDLILMDVRMPEMDGFQATRTIRARGGRLALLPIIAFTANAFPEDVKACRDAGMNDFVVKPARKRALVEAILRVIPAPSTDSIPEYAAPPLAAEVPDVDPNLALEPALNPGAYEELAREIEAEGAREIRGVFRTETDARLKLLRQLMPETHRARIGRKHIR